MAKSLYLTSWMYMLTKYGVGFLLNTLYHVYCKNKWQWHWKSVCFKTITARNSFKYFHLSKLLWSLTIYFFDFFSVISIYHPGTMVIFNPHQILLFSMWDTFTNCKRIYHCPDLNMVQCCAILKDSVIISNCLDTRFKNELSIITGRLGTYYNWMRNK